VLVVSTQLGSAKLSRRKTGCLTDHSRAPQPFPISLDSNQANELTN